MFPFRCFDLVSFFFFYQMNNLSVTKIYAFINENYKHRDILVAPSRNVVIKQESTKHKIHWATTGHEPLSKTCRAHLV